MVIYMAIVYHKLMRLLAARQISFYRLKKSANISDGTLSRLRHNHSVSMATIDRICRVLQCQPGDLMEYIEDSEHG